MVRRINVLEVEIDKLVSIGSRMLVVESDRVSIFMNHGSDIAATC